MRWGSDSGHRSADGRDLPITAEAFFQRANLELAWRTTRWDTQSAATATAAATDASGLENTGVLFAQAVQGQTMMASTVSCTGALLSAPQHHVSAIGFDAERGHCVTGDTDGTVRIWDIAHCVHAGSVGEPMGRECRLGLHRLHHKGHPVRWAAVHGRRLLAGCAAGRHEFRDDATHSPGRLVLVDLDDTSTNPGQRCLGVAASSVDAFCGLIGTGPLDQGTGNGIPEQMGWTGIRCVRPLPTFRKSRRSTSCFDKCGTY